MVVLIACLLALFAVREAMRLTIAKEARELLRDEALELELAVKQLHPELDRIKQEFNRKVLGHQQHGWFAALFVIQDDSVNSEFGEDNPALIWKSDNFPDSWRQEIDDSFLISKLEYIETQTQLIIYHPIKLADESRLQIILGEPTQFIRNDVWQLTKIMLYIGAALLIVAPVGGYLLAYRATRPVREIISTTRSLDPAHLESRLPIRGTGDELDQLSTEINSFVDQISKYIQSQREFVANAAHELRSPITAIQTSVEVTLDAPRSPAEYQDELETVSEQCQQLRHLVNQLLELAETDAATDPGSFETVELVELIRTSVDVFSGVAEEKEIAVKIDFQERVFVKGDAPRLRQVINNLLDNAIKFSPPKTSVNIRINSSGNQAILIVEDSGPGVEQEFLNKIFERFFQIDKSRERNGRAGNGLGLSICKAIVEQHGGEITAANTGHGPTHGLAMRVSLPL